jgi:hypothetical protein
MSHTIYAAKFEQTIIHQHIHLRRESQSHAPVHVLMRLYPIDKSLFFNKAKEGRYARICVIWCTPHHHIHGWMMFQIDNWTSMDIIGSYIFWEIAYLLCLLIVVFNIVGIPIGSNRVPFSNRPIPYIRMRRTSCSCYDNSINFSFRNINDDLSLMHGFIYFLHGSTSMVLK